MIQVYQSEPIKPQAPKPIVLKCAACGAPPPPDGDDKNKNHYKASYNNYCNLLKEVNKNLNNYSALKTYENVLVENAKQSNPNN